MKDKKTLIFIVLIILVGVVGGTFAYYSHSKSIDNKFIVGDFNVVIDETPSEGIELTNQVKDITGLFPQDVGNTVVDTDYDLLVDITNKENTDAIIRISYNEYLKGMTAGHQEYGADESEYEIAHNIFSGYGENSAVEKYWTTEFTDNFIYKDGWYYYKKVLPANQKINILDGITTINLYTDNFEKYMLDFNLEAVQATPSCCKRNMG